MAAFVWNVDREIVSLGPLALRWYSVCFAMGFIIGYFFIRNIFRKEGKSEELLDSLLVHLVVGTIIGARLGHVLFYDPAAYFSNPISILKVWEGGLASHGGFTGVIIALMVFAAKHRDIGFFWLADRIAIPAMLAATFIRIGNFFNSEIVGRPTDMPWGIVFPKLYKFEAAVPRHPTQLYEAIGYFLIFLLLYTIYRLSDRKVLEGRLFGIVMVVAYSFRLFIENFKEVQEDFEQGLLLNMGQILSIPFILIGLFFAFGLHTRIPWFKIGFAKAPGDNQGSTASHKKHPARGRNKKRK